MPRLAIAMLSIYAIKGTAFQTNHIHKSIHVNFIANYIFCVDAMYSGEYDACDVTLSVYPHRASLKNMPVHGGNRAYDLWNTSPMLCQLSYAVRSSM